MLLITPFARGSSVPAATLNALQQRAVGLRRASGAPSGALALAGRDGAYWCTGDLGLADGTAIVVDAARDWTTHHLEATFVRLTAADQRMHGAAAWKRNDPSATHGIAVRRIDDALTGTGCAASDGVPTISSGHFGIILDELTTGADRVFLFADSENDGALTLYNASGATLHAELFVAGASASAQGGGTSTVPGFSTGDVDTGDAAWTTIVTLSPATSTALVLRGTVAAIRDDATEAGGWEFTVRVRRGAAGNPVTGTAFFTLADHDGTGWDVRAQTSGATVVVQVHGEAAANITWRAEIAATEARPS
jgi:hypothetical protein